MSKTEKTTRGCAVVTGASSGIGEAFARRLGRDGYHVVLVARRADRLNAIAREIRETSATKAEAIVADLTDGNELRTVERQLAHRNDLELLINNAGAGNATRFAECDPDRIEAEIQLNVVALVRLTRAALPGMLRRGSGGIINVSSMAAFQPNPFFSTYGASKAYVNSFSEALSEELRASGVRVLVVCPGPVRTEFGKHAGVDESNVPAFTYLTPEDVVEDSMAAFQRGEVVHVPGRLHRMFVSMTSLLPRSVVRRASYQIGKRFFE